MKLWFDPKIFSFQYLPTSLNPCWFSFPLNSPQKTVAIKSARPGAENATVWPTVRSLLSSEYPKNIGRTSRLWRRQKFMRRYCRSITDWLNYLSIKSDITSLQVDMVDPYNNLTLKTLFSIRFVDSDRARRINAAIIHTSLLQAFRYCKFWLFGQGRQRRVPGSRADGSNGHRAKSSRAIHNGAKVWKRWTYIRSLLHFLKLL